MTLKRGDIVSVSLKPLRQESMFATVIDIDIDGSKIVVSPNDRGMAYWTVRRERVSLASAVDLLARLTLRDLHD